MPSELSGGMTKRVAIARAISMQPKYLLCDEPNSGLDPKTAILIDNLIHEITEEFDMTTIVNTHDMNSVMQIGDNIAFIYNGSIWWRGNKKEIINSENKELNEFVFASDLFTLLKNKNEKVKPKKYLGQHFLNDENISQKIVQLLENKQNFFRNWTWNWSSNKIFN